MFVHQVERNMTSKLNEVMNQLNLALKREEEAENLLKEQTRQLEELNRRIDGAATEELHKERALTDITKVVLGIFPAWDFSGLGFFRLGIFLGCFFPQHKFCIKPPENPEETRVTVGSYEHGIWYISEYPTLFVHSSAPLPPPLHFLPMWIELSPIQLCHSFRVTWFW